MPKIYKLKNCLLISLGAYGKNNLISNGEEYAKVLKEYYENLSIISSDKYFSLPRIIRRFFYIKDIFLTIYSSKPVDIFVHMNTMMAFPIILSPFRKKNKIISWYSHKRISWFTKMVLKRSDIIITASPEVKTLFPKSIFTHAILYPKKNDIKRCRLKKNSKRELIFIGRFSKVKGLDLFVNVALEAAKLKLIDGVRIIASSHEKNIEKMVYESLKECQVPVKIYKDIPNKNIYSFFNSGDILFNAQKTGICKVVLEASSIGAELVVVNNEMKNLIKTMEKRTLNGLEPVKESLDILRNIINLDLEESLKESALRISSTSGLSVFELIKNSIKKAYS